MGAERHAFHRGRGFTLIELLVVVSIIALLVAILLPSLQSARSAAQRVVCANHQRQLHLASHMYAHDFRSYLPPGQWDYPEGVPGQRFWVGALKDGYLPPWSTWITTGVRNYNYNHPMFCPVANPNNAATYAADFSINTYMGARSQTVNGVPEVRSYASRPCRWVRVDEFPNLILYIDTAGNPTWSNYDDFSTTRWRHDNTVNVVFNGGHIQSFAYEGRSAMWTDYGIRRD